MYQYKNPDDPGAEQALLAGQHLVLTSKPNILNSKSI